MPSPLACAVLLALIIAIGGRPARHLPDAARVNDRIDDGVTGVVGGPLIRTPNGVGAPLHADVTTVWIWTTAPIAPGQRVVAVGPLRTPRGTLGPGSPDRAVLVASRGAEWEMTASHVEVLEHDASVTGWIWRWADRTQRMWASRVDASDAAGAALSGIVVGDRAAVPDELDQRWRAVGIYHVLSVSGLHLAVAASLAFWVLSKLFAASALAAHSRPARWAAPPALALAIAYTLITGAQLATLRALIVIAVALVAKACDRPLRLVDALGLAAIVILIWRPQDLYDPSFQLSFIAALTLALRPQVAPLEDATLARRVARWIARSAATSAWVAFTTAPVTALHFQQVAVGGVLGNLVLTPLVELVALPVGLVGIVLDIHALIALATSLVRGVDAVAGVLAVAVPVGTIALGSQLVMVASVVIALWLASRERRARIDAAAWLALCFLWAFARTPPPRDSLRVTFLDVGQGDAAILELPDGQVWLVDAGGQASARKLETASATGLTIERALAVYGHHAIDLAILSHPHPDHYLGLAALTIPVGELWVADAGPDVPGQRSFSSIARALRSRGTRIVTPPLGTLGAGDVELSTWAPRFQPSAAIEGHLAPDPVRTVNDNSLVVSVRYAGRTLLFTGDIEAEGEELLVAAGIGRVDVVKVAHHGSRTSSTRAFVDATRPTLAVISCGVANAFGFPASVVLERWRSVGARVERTDQAGAITVTIDRDGDIAIERFVERSR